MWEVIAAAAASRIEVLAPLKGGLFDIYISEVLQFKKKSFDYDLKSTRLV